MTSPYLNQTLDRSEAQARADIERKKLAVKHILETGTLITRMTVDTSGNVINETILPSVFYKGDKS